MLAYSAALSLGLLLSSPWWLLRLATTERYREGLRQRLGAVPRRLTDGMHGYGFLTKVVWIHAVSVGEVLAASRLVAELESALGDGWGVVISTTTRTGQALARERFGAERVFYMPLDFGFAVRAYLRALRPAALILMESELWPRMLHECRRAGVPVAVVNARVSDRSFARAMKLQWIWSRVLRGVTLWLAQSEEDARRLVAMGGVVESVRSIGNLKYDVRAPKQSRIAELIKEAAAGRPIVVAGSTVGGEHSEDSLLIDIQQSSFPGGGSERPLLVLAPRHPERFDLIYSTAAEFPTLRATEMLEGQLKSQATSTRLVEIIILDTIGDLASVYGIADVAFVGGSLEERGGHNPLEPAQFGVPVVMGPSYENFRGIVEAMRKEHAIRIVDGPDDLEETIINFLSDRKSARAMGERGRRVFEEQEGATARAVEAIVAMVTK